MTFDDDGNQEAFSDNQDEVASRAEDVVLPAGTGRLTLPQAVSLDDLTVEGRDLVVTLQDGSRIVVEDGAINVPQIVVEGATIPAQTIAVLLTGNEPEPAAGPVQSSGGNFAQDEGAIQAAFDIGDLLPFTELAFAQDEEEEIFPDLVDEEPEVVIETIDNPVGVENATATVDEDGLPERGDEPEGTASETDSETTSGTIVFEASDGLSAILINGVEFTGVGQTFTTDLGVLTITGANLETGEIDFT